MDTDLQSYSSDFQDYNKWSIDSAYSLWDLALTLTYIDTHLSDGECADGCDAKAIFAISWDFLHNRILFLRLKGYYTF